MLPTQRSICLSCLAHKAFMQVEHRKHPTWPCGTSIVCSLWPPHSVAASPCGSVSYSKIIPWGPLLRETSIYRYLVLPTSLPVATSPWGQSPRSPLFQVHANHQKKEAPSCLCSPPFPPKLALLSSQAPDLGSHGQPCLAGWMICSESLLCAWVSASSTVQGQKKCLPFHPVVVSKPEQEGRQLTPCAVSPGFMCALECVQVCVNTCPHW